MAWTTPPTLTDGQILTGAHTQIWRDDLLETAPAKATTAGQYFVSTGANAVAARVPTGAGVSAAETTTSTSYVNLATTGPTVASLVTGTQCLVIVTARQANNTATTECYTSFEITGSTSVSASDNFALFFQPDAINRSNRAGAALIVTGMTAGTSTFTAKYRVSGGTGTFQARQIVVMPF